MRKCWNCGEPTEDDELRVCADPICEGAATNLQLKRERLIENEKIRAAERRRDRLEKQLLSAKRKATERLNAAKAKRSTVEQEAIEASDRLVAYMSDERIAAEAAAEKAAVKLAAYQADAWMVAAEKKTTKESKKLKAAERRAMKRAWNQKLKTAAYAADSWMENAEIITAKQSNSMIHLNKYEREYLRGIRIEVTLDDRLLACPACDQLSRYHRYNSTIDPFRVDGKLKFIVTLHCKCVSCGCTWDANPTDITL